RLPVDQLSLPVLPAPIEEQIRVHVVPPGNDRDGSARHERLFHDPALDLDRPLSGTPRHTWALVLAPAGTTAIILAHCHRSERPFGVQWTFSRFHGLRKAVVTKRLPRSGRSSRSAPGPGRGPDGPWADRAGGVAGGDPQPRRGWGDRARLLPFERPA